MIIYIYIITTVLKGGRTQNVGCIFQGVFEGGTYILKVF